MRHLRKNTMVEIPTEDQATSEDQQIPSYPAKSPMPLRRVAEKHPGGSLVEDLAESAEKAAVRIEKLLEEAGHSNEASGEHSNS